MTATSSAAWVRETDAGGITWLTFDKPGSSTNTLSRDTLLELDAHLKAVAEAVPKGLVIRSGKSGGFIAGADVKEFGELRSVEQGVEMGRPIEIAFDLPAGLRPARATLWLHDAAGGPEREAWSAFDVGAQLAGERIVVTAPGGATALRRFDGSAAFGEGSEAGARVAYRPILVIEPEAQGGGGEPEPEPERERPSSHLRHSAGS